MAAALDFYPLCSGLASRPLHLFFRPWYASYLRPGSVSKSFLMTLLNGGESFLRFP